MFPEGCVNELEEGDDIEGSKGGARRLAVKEEIKELESDWMTLIV